MGIARLLAGAGRPDTMDGELIQKPPVRARTVNHQWVFLPAAVWILNTNVGFSECQPRTTTSAGAFGKQPEQNLRQLLYNGSANGFLCRFYLVKQSSERQIASCCE